MRLDSIFDIKNGLPSSQVEVLQAPSAKTIPYIRPSSRQHRTVAGFVEREKVSNNNIYPAKTIFVSTDGQGSHSYSYVSDFDFVPNSNVCVLVPKVSLSTNEKIFYAMCITKNRNKFSYGRKPKGERLARIELPCPEEIPEWVHGSGLSGLESQILQLKELSSPCPLSVTQDSVGNDRVKVSDIFDISYGTSLELSRLERNSQGVNFISRTSQNNGVSAKITPLENVKPIDGNVLTVAAGGSVLETFYQAEPFYTGFHVLCLKPKKSLLPEEMLFYAACIRKNKYLYSYGRQANKTLKDILIPAQPAIPRWVYGILSNTADKIII